MPARDYFRVAWRTMADNVGNRTLTPAIIPPGAAHVDGVYSAGVVGDSSGRLLLLVAGFLGSLINDFSVRTAPKSTIRANVITRLAIVQDHPLEAELLLRVARLNCLTRAYAPLWSEAWREEMVEVTWSLSEGRPERPDLGGVSKEWTVATPLRVAADRRLALIEVDALVALMVGLSADELCTIYRTQFAVLNGHDRDDDYFDAMGRIVPTSMRALYRKKGERLSSNERTATNPSGHSYTYELPFATLDREVDMRRAYGHFEHLLKERS